MNNKTFRLFISSTFNDFIDEREALNGEIFSEIDSFCKKRGYRFQIIDLRWGIATESALNQKTLSICLAEVKRCKNFSPKPNFLIMVGERYGWIPLPPAIDKTLFENILSNCENCDIKVLKEWYILDENKISGEYYLKERKEQYIDENIWSEKETEIREILIKCIKQSDFQSDDMVCVTSSATEQEILEGFLNNTDRVGNSIAFFRDGYFEIDQNQSKVQALRTQIEDKLISEKLEKNIIRLDYSVSEYICLFKNQITEVLKRNIAEEINRLEKLNNEFAVTSAACEDYIQKKQERFVGRKLEIEKISEYISDNQSKGIMWIVGDSGTGKTSLLANYILNHNDDFFYSFFGSDNHSYTLLDALRTICNQIGLKYKTPQKDTITIYNIFEIFLKTIKSIPEEKKAVIILDGFDSFLDLEKYHQNMFPHNLPENVRIIISAANKNYAKNFGQKSDIELRIESLSFSESRKLFDSLLEHKGRCISNKPQNELINRALGEGIVPLKVWIMAELCSFWHSQDENVELMETSEELVQLYLENMFKKFGHNQDLLLNSLALIVASPFGLSEDEMQELLFCYEEVRTSFALEDRYSYCLNKIPIVIWSRLFYDLEGCLSFTNIDGHFVIKFSHQILYDVVTKYYREHIQKAIKVLTRYYLSSDNFYDKKKVIPNTKKTKSILFLLKIQKDYKKIIDLLCDLSFVDACIKSHDILSLFDAFEYVLLNDIDYEIKQNLLKIYSCILYNQEMLEFYCDNFFRCAYSNGLVSEKQPIMNFKKELLGQDKRQFFPYSTKSYIVWDSTGNLCAAYYGTSIYVYSFLLQKEIAKIVIDEVRDNVQSLVWLDGKEIAFATLNNNLYIYNISDKIPQVLKKEHFEESISNFYYSSKLNTLFFTCNDFVTAYDLKTYSIKFYSSKKNGSYRPFFDEKKATFGLLKGNRKIDFFCMKTGEKLKDSYSPYPKKRYSYYLDDGNCYLLQNNKLLVIDDYGLRIKIFDLKSKTNVYLYPPNIKNIKSFIVGGKYIVLQYENYLLNIDISVTDFPLSVYEIDGINDIAWQIKDKTLSVLCNNGLYILDIKCFKKLEKPTNCYTSYKYIIGGLKDYIKKIIPTISSVFNLFKVEDQKADLIIKNWFAFENLTPKRYHNQLNGSANLICEANDHKIAVAFELFDYISIFDKKGEPLYILDKLNLSTNDSIIRISFSPDSKHFLVWRLKSVVVINLENGKRVFDLNLKSRPALAVDFDKESQCVKITLCNGEEYSFLLNNKVIRTENLPRKLVDKTDEFPYFPAYVSVNKNGCYCTYSCVEEDSGVNNDLLISQNPSEYFSSNKVYVGCKRSVLFQDGVFYLMEDFDIKKMFVCPYDFLGVLQKERQKNGTFSEAFIFEKNDVSSELLDWGKYMVLVSKVLNSVIVFDTEKMVISVAYKHHGKIIGFSQTDNTLELYSDQSPYKSSLEFSIAD